MEERKGGKKYAQKIHLTSTMVDICPLLHETWAAGRGRTAPSRLFQLAPNSLSCCVSPEVGRLAGRAAAVPLTHESAESPASGGSSCV